MVLLTWGLIILTLKFGNIAPIHVCGCLYVWGICSCAHRGWWSLSIGGCQRRTLGVLLCHSALFLWGRVSKGTWMVASVLFSGEHWSYRHVQERLAFYMGAGNSNSGSLAHSASHSYPLCHLPSSHIPSLRDLFFFRYKHLSLCWCMSCVCWYLWRL